MRYLRDVACPKTCYITKLIFECIFEKLLRFDCYSAKYLFYLVNKIPKDFLA